MSKMRFHTIGSSRDVSVLWDEALTRNTSFGTGSASSERSSGCAKRGFGGDPFPRSKSARTRFRPACARAFGWVSGIF